MLLIPVMTKLNIQQNYSSLTWSFRNHCNVLIWCSFYYYFYYHSWKQGHTLDLGPN